MNEKDYLEKLFPRLAISVPEIIEDADDSEGTESHYSVSSDEEGFHIVKISDGEEICVCPSVIKLMLVIRALELSLCLKQIDALEERVNILL